MWRVANVGGVVGRLLTTTARFPFKTGRFEGADELVTLRSYADMPVQECSERTCRQRGARRSARGILGRSDSGLM